MTIAVRAVALGNTSTSSTSVTWPTHQTNDIGLLIVEACGGETISLSTSAGFAQITNSPQATGSGTSGTRVAVYWVRCTSGSMASPVIADAGDHVIGTIISFSGCITHDVPYNVTAGGVKASASTSATLSAVTTTVPNTMIVYCMTADITGTTSWTTSITNANLTSLTKQYDDRANLGNGGGITVYTGLKADPGDTGTASWSGTSSINAFITLALKPPPTARSFYTGLIG